MTIDGPFHPVSEGSYVYFAIQSRVTHLSPHNKPDGILSPVCDVEDGFGRPYKSEWGGMVGEYIAEPWKNNKPIYKDSCDEKHDVWSKTGGMGWWQLRFAVNAMRRLVSGSDAGLLNYRDSYNRVTRAVRYEFRIVKVAVSKRVDIVTQNELIESI